jgi:hypothetical protein
MRADSKHRPQKHGQLGEALLQKQMAGTRTIIYRRKPMSNDASVQDTVSSLVVAHIYSSIRLALEQETPLNVTSDILCLQLELAAVIFWPR